MPDPYVDPLAGQPTSNESSLSNWAGPYVTDMLGKGQALSELPYTAYQGPLTAGASDLQNQSFGGLGGLDIPTDQMGTGTYTPTSFTADGVAGQYMSPYIQQSLEPQIAEAQRLSQLQQLDNSSRMSSAGAFGGSRQAIMDSESQRNYLRNAADITGRGYDQAFTQAQGQFNTEQDRLMGQQDNINRYGLSALNAQQQAGGIQRGIEAEGIAADMNQFEQERDYPYKQVQFQQSLLQDLPVATQSYSYAEPSGFTSAIGGAGSIVGLLNSIFGE